MPHMTKVDRTRLRTLISEQGKTPRSLSREIGDNPYIVRDILSARSKNPSIDTMTNIAQALKVPVSELLTNDGFADVRSLQLVPKFLEVRYRVQAGAWFQTDAEWPPEDTSIAVMPNPRYAEFPQWIERVVGDSANKKIPDGFYVHVVDAVEMGYVAGHNDWVIVERTRDQGGLRERTIKQVELLPQGKILLWPRSTNPQWQEPVDLTAGARPGEEGIEVRIVGKVIASIDPAF